MSINLLPSIKIHYVVHVRISHGTILTTSVFGNENSQVSTTYYLTFFWLE